MIHGLLYRQPSAHRFEKKLDEQSLKLSPVHETITTWASPHCWLVQSSCEGTPLLGQDSPIQITAWARLDNREELAQKLNILPKQLNTLSDTALILKAYQTYAEACTQHLFGDFCFAIYDTRTQTMFCARDQMGVKPFYYYLDERLFAFSTSLAMFHKLDCVPVKPSMAWASKFLLANLSMDFEKTAYDKIFKLPPASQINITPTDISQKKYFEFHTKKISERSSEAYVELYQAQLERAIKTRIQTNHPLGTESSGGIDSSTITAYAAKYFERPLDDLYTFSFAHLEEEARHILSVSQQYNLSNNYICCDALENKFEYNHALRTLGAPVEHGNATHHQVFYDLAAKHRIRALLSGFGGDEFVTSIHGDLYLYELLNNKQYVTLYKNLLGNSVTRALRFAKLCYKTTPDGGKISRRMQHAFRSRWPDVIIAEDLIHAYGIQETYNARGAFDHGYANLDQFTLENRWAPFVSTRLENCTLMAASYGIEYRWPLLDPQLIQCFLSIPSSEKYKQGIGRYLHRKAIAGIVPDNITWKASKYMGERVTSRKNNPTLNTDLHPDLLPLINLPKLKKQADHLLQNQDAMHQFMQNIHHVNQLDHWLKYHFEHGCDWADAPA
ncbi:MAG: asparagine synthetase B family protein [Legionella sp.]|nr:asparagine synthetase B family protein [Legionella sp.]